MRKQGKLKRFQLPLNWRGALTTLPLRRADYLPAQCRARNTTLSLRSLAANRCGLAWPGLCDPVPVYLTWILHGCNSAARARVTNCPDLESDLQLSGQGACAKFNMLVELLSTLGWGLAKLEMH